MAKRGYLVHKLIVLIISEDANLYGYLQNKLLPDGNLYEHKLFLKMMHKSVQVL